MEEIWKDIKNYEGLYQISNLGRIKSLTRLVRSNNNNFRPVKEKILKQSSDKNGYKLIMLCNNGIEKTFLVHRLVAEAFIENPNNYPVVNHKDEKPYNNCAGNLEWCTISYNNKYGTRIKRQSDSMKKEICQYDIDGKFIKKWDSAIDVYKNLGYDFSAIRKCCRGINKNAYGYIWRDVSK